jgi:hypothetical protein
MLDPEKTREREALLKRIRELQAEIAQSERICKEIEAQLPIEEQLCLNCGGLLWPTFLSLHGKSK